MPAFGGRLSAKQIDAIATYVARSAGKEVDGRERQPHHDRLLEDARTVLSGVGRSQLPDRSESHYRLGPPLGSARERVTKWTSLVSVRICRERSSSSTFCSSSS